MRPFFERLTTPENASWSMLDRRLDAAIPFQWHHHPELELTLTLNSRGQRFIGDHVGAYGDGDLVMVGPNLTHTWSSSEKIDPDLPHTALVIWLRQEWIESLTANTVELAAIRSLIARAGRGLKFSDAASAEVRNDFITLFDLAPAQRLLSLLGILNAIAGDENATPLARTPASGPSQQEGRERIDRVLTHIHTHYAGATNLEALADIAALSLSGLHRMFRKHTQTNISKYLTQLRIGNACARLSGTDQPIQHIADAAGYGSAANFNRQFLRAKGMTPRDYRAKFRPAAA